MMSALATEARTFLAAAKAAGPRQAAFYALALDSGARKGELCGLRWTDLDLDAGKLTISGQLLKPGAAPAFGPTKTGRARVCRLPLRPSSYFGHTGRIRPRSRWRIEPRIRI